MPSTQTDRLQGLTTSVAVKAPVLCASTGDLTLSSTQVIDGVTVSTGDRVLVKDQTTATENGIYIVDSASWSRAKDADGVRDLVIGTVIYVSTGSTANTNYERFFTFGSTSSTSNVITPGTDTITIAVSSVLSTPSAVTVTAFAETLLDDDTAAEMRGTLDAQEDVITTTGDIVLGATDVAARLAIGASGTFLMSTGGTLAYESLTDTAREYTKTQNFNATTLTDSSSIAWDVSQNQVSSVTLAGNREMAAPTNMVGGAYYGLAVIQDGTEGRTLSYNLAFQFPGGAAPTLSTSTGARDEFVYRSDGSKMYLIGQALNQST